MRRVELGPPVATTTTLEAPLVPVRDEARGRARSLRSVSRARGPSGRGEEFDLESSGREPTCAVGRQQSEEGSAAQSPDCAVDWLRGEPVTPLGGAYFSNAGN